MTMPEQIPQEARYELTLVSFPDHAAIIRACELIYHSKDKNLVASLSSTPYVIGRSFSKQELMQLHENFKSEKIGHRFLAKPPHQDLVEYDPNAKVVSESKQDLSINKSSKKFPIKIIFISLACLIALSLVVFLLGKIDITPIFSFQSNPKISNPKDNKTSTSSEVEMGSSSPSSAETASAKSTYDAKLEDLMNKVEYRRRDQVSWGDADLGLLLHNRDALRTFAQSSALIRYRGGSAVRLKENTLLTVGESSRSSDDSLTRELNLENGSIHTRLAAVKTPQEIKIKTSQGVLEIKSSAGLKDNTNVETSFNGKKLKIAVASGSVNFKYKGKVAKEVHLQSHQQITSTKSGVTKPQVYHPSLTLYFPKQRARIDVKENLDNAIQFKWEPLFKGVTYQWSIATDSKMQNILLKKETQDSSLSLAYLDIGSLYWQVKATLDGVLYVSPIQQIYVQKHNN